MATSIDAFGLSTVPGLLTPLTHAVTVVPSDTVDLVFVTRAITVTTSGLVYVNTFGGETNVPIFVGAGQPFPIRVTRIYATGFAAGTVTSHWLCASTSTEHRFPRRLRAASRPKFASSSSATTRPRRASSS